MIINGAGYFCYDDPNGAKLEDDVLTCAHCQAVILVHAWKDEGAWCGRCKAAVCNQCGHRMGTYGCESWKRQIETMVKERHRKQQNRETIGF